MRRISASLVCVAALTIVHPALAAPYVMFSDDFESPTSTATTWFSPDDVDPATPPVGQNWTVVESNPWEVQQAAYAQNLGGSPPEFGAASGSQYLHMIRTTSQAWASLSSGDQALVSAAGRLHLSVQVFGMSGNDGWGSDLRIKGFDSAATLGTNPAFDVQLVDGGYGFPGAVNYTDGGGSHTISGLVNQVNVWQTLNIDIDFASDTYSLSLDGNTVTGLTWAGGDLSKIQSVELTLGTADSRGTDVRGGFDNISLSLLPEPASLATMVLASGMLVRARRRHSL